MLLRICYVYDYRLIGIDGKGWVDSFCCYLILMEFWWVEIIELGCLLRCFMEVVVGYWRDS